MGQGSPHPQPLVLRGEGSTREAQEVAGERGRVLFVGMRVGCTGGIDREARPMVSWELGGRKRTDAGTLGYLAFAGASTAGSRPLTCPAEEGLAPGGWTEALPRPAPSAGVPLVASIEQMFACDNAHRCALRDRPVSLLTR
jgi:hypothetical protein